MIPAAPPHHASLPVRIPRPGRLIREVRARRRPPSIGEETVRAVLGRYGVASVGPLVTLPVGWRSDNVVVSTADGSVVVKRYPARAARETILHEHSIARRLAGGGFPVAPLRTSPDGASCATVEDRFFSVTDLVRGVSLNGCYVPPAGERRLYRDAGALLAWFHDELETFQPEGRHHLGLQTVSRGRGNGTDSHLRSLERLRHVVAAGASESTERWLAARSNTMSDAIRELGHRLAQRELAVGVIHGDYGLHNLTYARDGSPTVHDLELARLDWLLIDVVVVLSRSRRACGQAFLEGYRSGRPLRAADWAALPEVWQHYRLCGAVRSWQNYRDQGGARRLVAARQRVEEADRVATIGVGGWE